MDYEPSGPHKKAIFEFPVLIVEEYVSTAEELTGEGRYTSVFLEIYLSRAATTGVYIRNMSQPSTLVGPHRMYTWGCDSCTYIRE